MTASRILILGNSGFVGNRLGATLAAGGMDVRGFSSKELNLLGAEAVLQLREAVRPEDTLVVISALTPDRGRDFATLIANIRMVESVCNALKDQPCAHLVYVSSDAVYSDNAHPVRESSCCDPTSFHGLMHLVRERALEAAARAKGIPAVMIRPTGIYGRGDTHNSYGPNRFVRTALKERSIQLFGKGEEQRDHVHIEDVVNVIRLCIERRTEGLLNVATGQSVSFFQVAEIVSGLAAGPVKVLTAPRQSPITHRHFDMTHLLRVFPTLQFKSLHAGLAEMMKT